MSDHLTQLGQPTALPHDPGHATLETVPNPHPGTLYLVRFTAPEFTSLCPITGQPDFAHLVLDYAPDERLVESKSLKLFFGSFRNHGAFHEDCTVGIAKRLIDVLAPRWLRIGGYWYPRGGMPIDIFYQSGPVPDGLWLPDQGVPTYRGRGVSGGPIDFRGEIRDRALALGFDAVGFAPARYADGTRERLRDFLDAGRHGDMGWMEANADRRGDPAVLWPDARSVVVLGANYGPESDPRALQALPDRGAVSAYARNRDYHDVLKKRLRQLAGWMHQTSGAEVKLFVDTAPVMEKPLAQAAGLGWQGKHTNLVSRCFGSWLFLAEVFTALELAPDGGESDHCGQCRACLDACPTAAFPAPYQIDARRCISYLTIEHKGQIPEEFRPLIGNRIYGCDDCLAACPWNKFAQVAAEPAFRGRPDLDAPALAELAGLDDAAFRAFFSGSPVKRIGRDRFVRNVLVAIGNSGSADLAPVAAGLLGDDSELVREMAAWAAGRLTVQPGGS